MQRATARFGTDRQNVARKMTGLPGNGQRVGGFSLAGNASQSAPNRWESRLTWTVGDFGFCSAEIAQRRCPPRIRERRDSSRVGRNQQ
jgi:hypothetical protein